MAYILDYAGCPPEQIGFVIGFCALLEIAAMFAVSLLKNRGSMPALLLCSGLLFGLEHLLYGFCHGLFAVLGVMVLSGLAGGIFYSVGPGYVRSIVEPEVQNTAESLSGITMAGTSILGTLLGGAVIERFGVRTLTTACGLLILLLTAIFPIRMKACQKSTE